MSKKNYLERANDITRQLKEIEHFLFTVTEFDKKEKAILGVNVFMKKKIDVKCSFFGSRFFGLGKHVQEIKIPNELRNDLIAVTKKRQKRLETDLKNLYGEITQE